MKSSKYLCLFAIFAIFSVVSFAEQSNISELTKCADNGHIDSQYLLGQIFLFGVKGCKQDLKKAIHYFSQAASKNHWPSQQYLGDIFDNTGPQQDHKTAVEWYSKAVQNGSRMAIHELYWHYHLGIGVTKNDFVAFSWLKKFRDPTEKNEIHYWLDDFIFDWEIYRKREIFHSKQIPIENIAIEAEKLKNKNGQFDPMICFRPQKPGYSDVESLYHNVYRIDQFISIEDIFNRKQELIDQSVEFFGLLEEFSISQDQKSILCHFSNAFSPNGAVFKEIYVKSSNNKSYFDFFQRNLKRSGLIGGILKREGNEFFIEFQRMLFD